MQLIYENLYDIEEMDILLEIMIHKKQINLLHSTSYH